MEQHSSWDTAGNAAGRLESTAAETLLQDRPAQPPTTSSADTSAMMGTETPRTSPPPSRAASPAAEKAARHEQAPPAHGILMSDGIQCCCGRDDCVFLRHNCSLIESVEADLHTAARLGQNLLARHEAFMATANRDRDALTQRVATLENDNKGLEISRHHADDENRALRDELDEVNEAVSDADTRISCLEATLRESQLEVRRLEAAAARAASMERQLAALEEDQVVLQTSLAVSRDQAKSAVQRWSQAKTEIARMQDQLEEMEREAREERERHVEALGRMERQRAVEKNLESSSGNGAGRFRMNARATTDGRNHGGALSMFIRDLMHDNSTMALGMAELRELLRSSYDEVQMLREQMLSHSPVAEGAASKSSTLRAELESHQESLSTVTSPTYTPARRDSRAESETALGPAESSRPSSTSAKSELHIHHHYHVKPEVKKPKKKRTVLTPAIFTPPASHHNAHYQLPLTPSTPPTAAAAQWARAQQIRIESGHTYRDSVSTVSVPSSAATNAHWSVFSTTPSDFAPSSLPSSPRSAAHRNSMLDFVESCSPGGPPSVMSPAASADQRSPLLWNAKRASAGSARGVTSQPLPAHLLRLGLSRTSLGSAQETIAQGGASTESTPSTVSPAAKMSEQEDLSAAWGRNKSTRRSRDSLPAPSSAREEQNLDILDSALRTVAPMPNHLRRTASRESIISLSNGLDIHTLSSRPGQMGVRTPFLGSLGFSSVAGANLSAVTARPTLSRGALGNGKRSSTVIKDNLVGLGLSTPPIPAKTSRPELPGSRGNGWAINRVMAGQLMGGNGGGTGVSSLGKLVPWRLWGGGGSNDDSRAPSPSSTQPLEANKPSSDGAGEELSTGTSAPSPTVASPPSSVISAPSATSPMLVVSEESPSSSTTTTTTTTNAAVAFLIPSSSSNPAKNHLSAASSPSLSTSSFMATGVAIQRPKSSLAPGRASLSSLGSATQPGPRTNNSSSERGAPFAVGSFRAPGINQPGAIPGFDEYFAAHQRPRAPPSRAAPAEEERERVTDGVEGSA